MVTTYDLKRAATRIGAAVGRADRSTQKIARVGIVVKKEIKEMSKEVGALKRQLLRATRRLKRALR
jgi:HAMP domain-containing protein